MLGILLVTHGNMSTGILDSCEMIIGKRDNIKTLSLNEEGVETFRERVANILSTMEETYENIIVVSDIPNATPYNECYRYILSQQKNNIKLLSGMNLAMVIELTIYAAMDKDVDELVDQVMETGRTSITKLTR